MSRNAIRWEGVVAISTLVSTIALIVTIVVSIFLAREQITETRNEVKTQIKEARDESKMQHLVEESARFDEPPILTARQALAAKRIDRNNETLRPITYDNAPPELWDILNNCDHIGLLTRKGYLDVSDVWDEMGYWLLNIYADAEPVIQSDRKGDPASDRKGDPASMVNCSWLVEQMRPLESKDNGVNLHPTPDDLYDFYNSELAAKPGELTTRKQPH